MSCNYPFSAIAGQEPMKTALLLNAVDPTLAGVLIRGQKGTAKSTAVRGLADLLPGRRIVELPVSATEDRLIGTMDIKAALRDGEPVVEPGLLSDADGNILYVDEVNLLADHLVDDILDAATSGFCTLERDGVRASYPARFALIGSMNPEEGELRPQMLDRFGLAVSVTAEQDPSLRAEIVQRRLAFEEDPEGFCQTYEPEQEALRQKICTAQDLLPTVDLSVDMVERAVELCLEAGAEGHRADIMTCKAARVLAAWNGRTCVEEADVEQAASLALHHRGNNRPFDSAVPDRMDSGTAQLTEPGSSNSVIERDSPEEPVLQEAVSALPAEDLSCFLSDPEARSPRQNDPVRGRMVRTAPVLPEERNRLSSVPIAFPATLRAAFRRNGTAEIFPEDWQKQIRESDAVHSILFVVDASGSLGAKKRIRAVKSLILGLLQNAHVERAEVGMIIFYGAGARMILPFTRSTQSASELLQKVPTGGRTPLAEGLAAGREELQRRRWKYPDDRQILVLVTDGRANAGQGARDRARKEAALIKKEPVRILLFDAEQGPARLGLAKELALELGAEYYSLDEVLGNES